VHDGLVTETLDRSIVVGLHVMWCVASRAIRFEPGRRSFAAVVESVELRNGGRFASVDINGV
jgi:urease beta subunit